MTPLLLVLLVAQSAWGANVLVRQYSVNDIPRPVETSNNLVSAYIIDAAWESVDQADTNINILNVAQIARDLARSSDPRANALALCQTVSAVGELGSGRAGDACDFADFIGSSAGLGRWISRIFYDIDILVALSQNREIIRDQTGPISNCVGGGRSYNFEAAWENLISPVNSFEVDLLNENYCTAKRLYRAWNARSNVVGAVASACVSNSAMDIFTRATPEVANLLRAVADGGDVYGAAANAKAAISRAAN